MELDVEKEVVCSEEEEEKAELEGEEQEVCSEEEEAEMAFAPEEQPHKPRRGAFFLSCTCCRSHAAARCRAHATRAGPLAGALVVGKYFREVLIARVA